MLPAMGAGIIDCDCASKFICPFILLRSRFKLLIFEQVVSYRTFRTISTERSRIGLNINRQTFTLFIIS
jgi:hypothetical protein